MPSARTRTNVGITTKGSSEIGVGTTKDFHTMKRTQQGGSPKDIRTSLPMALNRGRRDGASPHERDRWQHASHNKVMLPTERVVRQHGENVWRSEPPQSFGRHMAPEVQRASAIAFNKFALDKDQDGVLDEASLFVSTSIGQVSAQLERGNATAALEKERSRNNSNATTMNVGNEGAGGVDGANGFEATVAAQTAGGGGGGGDVEVDALAAQRALVGEILLRNSKQLHMIPLNPGSRHADRNAKLGGSSWQAVKDGPTGQATHFNADGDGNGRNVDAAMDVVSDHSTYNGDFPLFVRDLYLAENRAKLTGSTQVKRILQPSRPTSLGGEAALHPPPCKFNGDAHAAAWESMGGDRGGQVRPNTAPAFLPTERTVGGFGATSGTTSSQQRLRGPGSAAGSPSSNNSGDKDSATLGSFGSVGGGSRFTSAFKVSSYFESDHLEAYEGQWRHSKTICPTSRGVRQAGEHAPIAGGAGRAGGAGGRPVRQGRKTVTTHLGPSRPNTTTGVSSNSEGSGGHSVSMVNGPQRRPPPGRWAQPDRGRQLPLVLHDSATQEGVRPFYFEPPVYNRDQSDSHTNFNSLSAWTSKARQHETKAWKRSANTLFTGSVYQATIPRSAIPRRTGNGE